jgi:DNA internalization-related competence protein ComEC/Rec2
MRRKLLAFVAAMVLGMIARDISYVTAAGLCLAAFFIYFKINEIEGCLALGIPVREARIMAVFAVTGVILMSIQLFCFDCCRCLDTEGEAVIRAEVIKVTKYEDEKYKLECRIISEDGRNRVSPFMRPLTAVFGGDRAVVSCFRNIDDHWKLTGCEVEFRGKAEQPDTAGNPHCFDYRRYLMSRKITHVSTAEAFTSVKRPRSIYGRMMRRISGLRERFAGSLGTDRETEAFIRGVLFGDSKMMPDETAEDFRKNGTAHVLAVSGLHVGVLYGVYRALLKKWRSRVLTAAFLAFLIFYGAITCWTVSVVRASILIILMIAGDALDRRFDMKTALAAALFIILAMCPAAVFSQSLIMSFLAVYGISSVQPFLQRHRVMGSGSAVAAQIVMAPYISYEFNMLPLAAVVINVPVVFMISVTVPLGMICLGLYAVSAGKAVSPFGMALCGLAQLVIKVNKIAAEADFAALTVRSMPAWALAAVYLIMFSVTSEMFFILWHRKRKKVLACAAALMTAAAFFTGAVTYDPVSHADAVMVDVGQGDCMHFRSGSVDVMIDGGGSERYDVGSKTLKPYLLKNGCADLDLACATHLHTDHYLGLEQLSHVFRIRKAVTKGRAGQVIKAGSSMYITVLWPENTRSGDIESEDENAVSMVFKVHINGFTVLVTGDISAEGEKMLLDRYKDTDALKCDVLKVPHHGSRYSSSPEFIRAADPKIALIGVGKNNIYGHPAPEVIRRYEKVGIKVCRTDLDGAIGIRRRGGKLTVSCERKRGRTGWS